MEGLADSNDREGGGLVNRHETFPDIMFRPVKWSKNESIVKK